MTIYELIDFTRKLYLDDTVEPYLWSDETLLQLAIQAQREACERADLIIDKDNHNFVTVAGQSDYTMSSNIIRIIKMSVVNDNSYKELERVYFAKTNYYTTKGTPYEYFYTDSNTIRLFPVPDKEYPISVVASVYPKTTELEIPEQFHEYLAYYIAGNALLSADLDASDPSRANEFLALFDAKFGPRKDTRALIREKLSASRETVMVNSRNFGFP